MHSTRPGKRGIKSSVCSLLFLGDAVDNCGKYQTNGVSAVQILCSQVAENLVWYVGANRIRLYSLFSQIQHSQTNSGNCNHLTGVKLVGKLHSGSENGLSTNAQTVLDQSILYLSSHKMCLVVRPLLSSTRVTGFSVECCGRGTGLFSLLFSSLWLQPVCKQHFTIKTNGTMHSRSTTQTT